jgi:hypothetical protein
MKSFQKRERDRVRGRCGVKSPSLCPLPGREREKISVLVRIETWQRVRF